MDIVSSCLYKTGGQKRNLGQRQIDPKVINIHTEIKPWKWMLSPKESTDWEQKTEIWTSYCMENCITYNTMRTRNTQMRQNPVPGANLEVGSGTGVRKVLSLSSIYLRIRFSLLVLRWTWPHLWRKFTKLWKRTGKKNNWNDHNIINIMGEEGEAMNSSSIGYSLLKAK